jgi:hypothetical protein
MVSHAQVAVLRAALTGDVQALEMLSELSGAASEEELSILATTAFIKAARKRFAPTWSGSDVIRFIGQVRAGRQREHSDIDAAAAEQMLISALGDTPLRGRFDEFAKGYAQAVLLRELTSQLDTEQLHTLLEEAREQANGWLAKHGH